MDLRIESLKEQLTIHRKNLSDLEIRKAQYGLDVPVHLKREIEQEEREIKRAEAEIRKVNGLMCQEVNKIRNDIIAALTEYNQIFSTMSEFENMFLTHVILPGYQLNLTIQKRRFLEREYNRIREAIERGLYVNPEEIDSDVRRTLKHAEVAYAYNEGEQTDESLRPSLSPTAISASAEPDSALDEKKKVELVKEFKRIVIPKVHSDTSEAPFEVFNSVYEAYKKKDYLLMEAFIIQYRGEFSPRPEEDPLIVLNLITTYIQEYKSVLERLEKRLEQLKRDMTIKELEKPEEVQVQMKSQSREIRKAIYEEAEQILHLRSCLENLIQLQLQRKGDS